MFKLYISNFSVHFIKLAIKCKIIHKTQSIKLARQCCSFFKKKHTHTYKRAHLYKEQSMVAKKLQGSF